MAWLSLSLSAVSSLSLSFSLSLCCLFSLSLLIPHPPLLILCLSVPCTAMQHRGGGASRGLSVTKVCNLDSLEAADVNRSFMLLLVQQLPAEVVLQLLSRIGMYRDRPSQRAYEALSRDFSIIVSRCMQQQPAATAAAAAAAAALLTRCLQTLPLPWAVDYVRRFGSFSKAFLAKQIERATKPRFFDFVRYQQHGGGRKPQQTTLTHPPAPALQGLSMRLCCCYSSRCSWYWSLL